jgi:KaiC/GvpD/RAD55 family RecA-like ATPase
MHEMRMGENAIRSTTERVSTGIEQLNHLLRGGFPQNSVILVSGTPGSGKTILCYHYIAEGIQKGEKCLYFTSDERIENIISQAAELGFDFQVAMQSGQLKFMYLDLEGTNVHKEMEQEIRGGSYSRVVLDSLTPVAETPVWVTRGGSEIIPSETSMSTSAYPVGSIPATRVHIRRIMSILDKESCTAMVTSEIPEGSRSLSRDSISEFLVDGILLMDLDMTMDRRKLTIRKMRGTKHTLKPQDIEITEGGIRFL